MKPTSEMSEQESACFVNLKKAMHESFLALEYLEQAQHLAPDDASEEYILTCVRMMNDTMTDIRHAVQSLTN